MSLLAIFGITDDGLNLAVNLLLLFLVVIWLALVYWTWADARRRIEDPMLVGCATAASLFPFVGTIVYMIVRPPEYIEDVRERELEIAAAEARLHSLDNHACPYCSHPVEQAYLRCPHCLRRLKEPCTTCGKPLDPTWKICPFCEAEVGQAPPKQARREGGQRRRARPAPDGAAQQTRERPATAAGSQRAAAGQRQAPQRQAERPPADRPKQRPPQSGSRPAAPPETDGGSAREPSRP